MIKLSNAKMKTKLLGVFLIAVVILLVTIVILKTGKVKDAPIVPAPDLSNHPIYSKYDFGKENNVIGFGIQPRTADWEKVRACFDLTIVEEILSGAREYQLDVYDYYTWAQIFDP